MLQHRSTNVISILVVGCIGLCVYFAKAAQTADFDLGMIKTLGLDPKVAEFFGKAPRFAAGAQRVAFSVNGRLKGPVVATFKENGELCFDRAVLDRAGLVVPQERYKSAEQPSDSQCYDFVRAFPQSEVELRPDVQEIHLLVSDDALRPETVDIGAYQYGGTAALLNYEVSTQVSQFAGQQSRYSSADTELGFNAGDWVVRSRQSYTVQDAVKEFQVLYSYAQKSFVSSASKLQVGQINISDSALPGASITGLQWVPEGALQHNSNPGAVVEGVAQQQARVEVRQNGALIHSSRVPAGPFRLKNIQLISGSADLDVRVVEDDGGQRSFIVPAGSLGQVAATSPGYSMAVGKLRTFDTPGMQSPMVLTGTGGWAVNRGSVLSAGLMVANNKYKAAGVTLNTTLGRNTSMSVSHTYSTAAKEGVRGGQMTLGISQQLTDAITASVNVSRQSRGYREIMDTALSDVSQLDNGYREQYGASIGWSNNLLGSFSAGYSQSKNFNGVRGTHMLLSWNKQFKYATVGVNLQQNKNSLSGPRLASNMTGADKALYVTVSVPLGKGRSFGSHVNKHNDNSQFGVTYSDTSKDGVGYRLAASQDNKSREKDFSVNANLLPRYAQVDLGYSQNGTDSSSYSARMRGGAALQEGAITLSPYPLSDTFAVVKVGDLSGVKVDTPSGPVWTDHWGRAAVAQINPYKVNRVEVQTQTLPRNVDIQNGLQELSLGRGAVSKVDFRVESQRRVLLVVSDAGGQPIRKGSVVLDAQGEYVTSVVDGGKVFLSNIKPNQKLSIGREGGEVCQLNFKLANKADVQVYFEQAKATCTDA